MLSTPIIYRVMRRLNDNSLVSPYTVLPFLEVSMTTDYIHQVIPYGFGFSILEKALYIINEGHPIYDAKFEVWSIIYDGFIPINHQLHSYQLHNKYSDYKELISECFFNQELDKMSIRVGLTIAPSDTVFCKNVSLCEKISQNY